MVLGMVEKLPVKQRLNLRNPYLKRSRKNNKY